MAVWLVGALILKTILKIECAGVIFREQVHRNVTNKGAIDSDELAILALRTRKIASANVQGSVFSEFNQSKYASARQHGWEFTRNKNNFLLRNADHGGY